MNIKKIAEEIFYDFFIIFSCITLSMIVYLWFLGYDFVPMHDIVAAFVISVLTSSTKIIFHSKRELKKFEYFIRNAIQLFTVIAIVFSVASYLRWISWNNLVHILIFLGITIGVYIIIAVITFYQTKKLADTLNEKLKERYKG